MTGEFASISAIQALLPVPNQAVDIWIGDDAAAVELPAGGGCLLLAADTVVGGVHADLGLTGLDDLGWKAMVASLSDIAAMGGEPGHALVTVAAPPETDLPLLYRGIAAAARAFGCPVVGGDLTNAPEIVVTVAVTGYSGGRPVSRSGARPGDEVWVTGPLGAAAAGLRLLSSRTAQTPADREAVTAHARPVPLLAAGRAALAAGATAMIDVSDGLSADLDHVVTASGVGLQLDSVPVHPAATLEEALGGGEDFVLAFCAPESAGVEVAFAALDTPIRIGRCTADPAERTLGGEAFTPSGWEHQWHERKETP
ncbi:MAG TPA: thiamine-phosphate kinase [Acidimicrobiales bacterium]|nr:thiamine-phosphate kinase [Acidimicrobiales bacterium]